MRKALVIGGAGFLGLHIVERLVEDGWSVTVFDMIPSWNAEVKVEYIRGDLCKSEVSQNYCIDLLCKKRHNFFSCVCLL